LGSYKNAFRSYEKRLGSYENFLGSWENVFPNYEKRFPNYPNDVFHGNAFVFSSIIGGFTAIYGLPGCGI
jgi:hypothetical protein